MSCYIISYHILLYQVISNQNMLSHIEPSTSETKKEKVVSRCRSPIAVRRGFFSRNSNSSLPNWASFRLIGSREREGEQVSDTKAKAKTLGGEY